MAGGMWPNCLGALRKACIRCPHQLVKTGKRRKKRDGAGAVAAGGVLSTFYVLTNEYCEGLGFTLPTCNFVIVQSALCDAAHELQVFAEM